MPVSMTATVTSLPVTSLSITALFQAAWMPARAVSASMEPRSLFPAQRPDSSTAPAARLALTSPQSVAPTASPLSTTGFGAGLGAGAGFGGGGGAPTGGHRPPTPTRP